MLEIEEGAEYIPAKLYSHPLSQHDSGLDGQECSQLCTSHHVVSYLPLIWMLWTAVWSTVQRETNQQPQNTNTALKVAITNIMNNMKKI